MEDDVDGSRASVRLPSGATAWHFARAIAFSIILADLPGQAVSAVEVSQAHSESAEIPPWVFPLNPPTPAGPVPRDQVLPLHVPNSNVTFTEAQLNDRFSAPDWHPASHTAMPPIVARGRPPDVYACGYCHTAGGQGRPENASLAGLPAAYILSQLEDFRSGARKSAWTGPYLPADLMIHAVTKATPEELSSAAAHFAAQTLRPRVVVLERTRVPRSHVVGWVYAAVRDGGSEPLGQRLLEYAPDAVRHENRDDEMRYMAYAPTGSLARGKDLVRAGLDSPANACSSCHGPQLRGVGMIPPIAGRSPTYILRQLFAFKYGARSSAAGLPMRNVVKNLGVNDMIDAAAFAASLPP